MSAKPSVVYLAAALIIGILIGAGIGYVLAAAPGMGATAAGQLPSEVPIGALLPLSGALSSYGENGKNALILAEEDINDYVHNTLGLNITFKIYVEDTKTSPDGALEAVKSLAAKGIKVYLGPYASSEAGKVLSYLKENNLVTISPSSTFPGLAIAGDPLFRTVPTDVTQGKALAHIIWQSGIRKLVLVYRNDDWGVGLNNAIKENFEAMGGTTTSIPYDPYAAVYSAEVSKIVDAVNAFGAGPDVGIVLISFEDDGIGILSLAKNYDVLMNVKWFGTDGIAYSSRIAESVGDVVSKVFVGSTIYTPAKSVKRDQFIERYRSRFGIDPHPYSMNLYDSAWIAALAILEARVYDGAAVAKVIPEVANKYFGVTGWTALDDAGDRAYGDYAITTVKLVEGKYVWQDVGVYNAAAGTVQWY